MRKILNLRGGHASGKTEAVRQFLKKHESREETIDVGEWHSPINVVDGGKVIVLGYYPEDGCGGVDRYRRKEQTMATIVKAIEKYHPDAIVYEGIMYSVTCKLSLAIAVLARSLGYEWKALLLERDIASRRALLVRRNNGADYSEDNFINSVKRARRSCEMLSEHGETIERIDVSGMSKEEMGKIIEQRV